VWWNVVGVAVIVVILIAVPSHHASCPTCSATANNSGFGGHMYWIYVLPLGFLLTMYTITGYDASAHVSEETHGAEHSAREGRLALGLLLGA
jgi:amino acid transporter